MRVKTQLNAIPVGKNHRFSVEKTLVQWKTTGIWGKRCLIRAPRGVSDISKRSSFRWACLMHSGDNWPDGTGVTDAAAHGSLGGSGMGASGKRWDAAQFLIELECHGLATYRKHLEGVLMDA